MLYRKPVQQSCLYFFKKIKTKCALEGLRFSFNGEVCLKSFLKNNVICGGENTEKYLFIFAEVKIQKYN